MTWMVQKYPLQKLGILFGCAVLGLLKPQDHDFFPQFFLNFLLPELDIESSPRSSKHLGHLPGSLVGILSLPFDLVSTSAVSLCQKSMG